MFQKYLYNTLDPVERVVQHQAVGNALEKLYRDETEPIAVHLARHFQEARSIEKAIQYWKQAGQAAARVYANTEAIAHYSRAIQLAQQVQLNDAELASLYTCLGRVQELDSSFDQALKTYERLEELAVQRSNRGIELASLMARITILAVPTPVHEPELAFELGERAFRLAKELAEPAAEAKILWNLSLANLFLGRLQEAIDCGERSLSLARQHNLVEQTAQTLNDLGGFIYLYSGRIDQAREALREASELWRKLGNMPMLTDSLSSACTAHVYTGEFDRAISFSEEAFRISHSSNNLWGESYSKWMVGDAYAERGEFSRAIEVTEECIHLGKRAGFTASQDYSLIRLASIHMELGSTNKALELVQEALALSQVQNTQDFLQGLGVLARLLVLKGDLGGAELCYRRGESKSVPGSVGDLLFTCLVCEDRTGFTPRTIPQSPGLCRAANLPLATLPYALATARGSLPAGEDAA